MAARRCSACEGHGYEIKGDWSQGYPKGRCVVCKGTGQMEPGLMRGEWHPAKGAKPKVDVRGEPLND